MKNQFPYVPYGKAVWGDDEINAIVSVLKKTTQMGESVNTFENLVSALFSKKHGIMVNSGSSANYLAIEVLHLPEGSEVITPALTFSTTVAPLVRNKLIPAFIDVEAGTYNIDANQIESMINNNTRAMMVPNLLGNLSDWPKLNALAKKYNLITIEDSCDTLGATINNISTGAYSDISTTSFYGSHIITCAGNGGMLCVNSDELSNRVKLLRSWGRSSSLYAESENIENRFNIELEGIPYDAKFVFEALGYNLEPSEIGAAFGLEQLKKLKKNMETRQYYFNQHLNYFKQYENWFTLPRQLPASETCWLAFPLTLNDNCPFQRRDLQIFLENRNIQTRTIFTGNILRQPGFQNIPHVKSKAGYPNADKVMRGGILIGCHHGMNDIMLHHIHDSFREFLNTVTVAKI